MEGMTTNHSPKKGVVECGTWNGKKVRPLFFKVVSGPGVDRIRLPPVFTRRHGHNLADLVSLEVPNGLVWKVELFRSNGEAWFQRGWQEFQEHYSLQFGNLLLFTYVGTCRFDVNIFDTTATEIDYSRYGSLAGKNVGRKHHVADSNPCPKRDKKRSTQQSDEKPRRSSRVKQNTSSFAKQESSRFLDSSPNHIDKLSEGTGLKFQDKNIQLAKASAFMSEKQTRNLFSIAVMLPSCGTTHKWPLPITADFAKEILQKGRNSSSIQLVCEGKTWAVRCIRGLQRASFTSGWREFAEDNDLKRGDTCVFEASARNNLAWDVTIFRG